MLIDSEFLYYVKTTHGIMESLSGYGLGRMGKSLSKSSQMPTAARTPATAENASNSNSNSNIIV